MDLGKVVVELVDIQVPVAKDHLVQEVPALLALVVVAAAVTMLELTVAEVAAELGFLVRVQVVH